MFVTLRSFSKINLGLCIGLRRADGFHDLRTVYQTIALHDAMRVEVGRGSGIEIRSNDPRVPKDDSNTCYRIAERAMAALGARGRVVIEIEKRLPVQGGLGGASGNAVTAMLGLERTLKKQLPGEERLRIAAEVGSDLPLFLVGGTILGVGRGEEVYPLPDLPSLPCVLALPEIAVSTPQAFADWDKAVDSGAVGLRSRWIPRLRSGQAREGARAPVGYDRSPIQKLTDISPSDRMNLFSRKLCSWLGGSVSSGVSARRGGRAETPLLDLVRTGIENDFEKVVFPKYPELREVKRVLERAGALYASLSGSGSAIYGLFASRLAAEKAAAGLGERGTRAIVTRTFTRRQYWKAISD
ncbi:MAG TPA: 4-(cytidine 5'-diphospho)-2-C-methyl-D-erythritol kinase [Terriglobales bacterium]|jgi:4-diphosphocytidyl-2-C-methyl-D-erythritol kinase